MIDNMATALRVPRRYEEGLAKIRGLSDESVQELLLALRELPSTVNEGSLSSAVALKTSTIPRDDVEQIVPALLSLYSLRDISGSSTPEDIAKRVAQGMEESGSSLLKLSPEDRASFESRLAELLSLDSVSIMVRAGTLLLEHEHSLREARVMTDIRPVFEPHNPKVPRAAVIVHTLKISYFDDNELKEFFVAFDTSDVRALSEQLERANLKAESLKSVLAAADVPYMDAE